MINNLAIARIPKAINTLFTLRTFKPPVDLNDENNIAGTLINNLIKEENIATHRSPLDNAIFAQIQQATSTSNNPDSDHGFLLDIVTLSRYIGPRVSKYAQTTQSKIDYHPYPSGWQVIKAFIADDFAFFDAAKRQLNFTDESSLDMADLVCLTWCIQKNQQNGQTITLLQDKNYPILCPVKCAARMILRAKRLEQPDSMPVGCYCTKKTPLVCMTANQVATLIREAVKRERPGITTANWNKYSAHSLCVWVCVLLDETGKRLDYIGKRLRWMGDLFCMYLRDTRVIQDMHHEALRSSLQEIIDLLKVQPKDVHG